MPEKRPFERLPADVSPINYSLCLKPDLLDFTFEGKLEAAAQVRRPSGARGKQAAPAGWAGLGRAEEGWAGLGGGPAGRAGGSWGRGTRTGTRVGRRFQLRRAPLDGRGRRAGVLCPAALGTAGAGGPAPRAHLCGAPPPPVPGLPGLEEFWERLEGFGEAGGVMGVPAVSQPSDSVLFWGCPYTPRG